MAGKWVRARTRMPVVPWDPISETTRSASATLALAEKRMHQGGAAVRLDAVRLAGGVGHGAAVNVLRLGKMPVKVSLNHLTIAAVERKFTFSVRGSRRTEPIPSWRARRNSPTSAWRKR